MHVTNSLPNSFFSTTVIVAAYLGVIALRITARVSQIFTQTFSTYLTTKADQLYLVKVMHTRYDILDSKKLDNILCKTRNIAKKHVILENKVPPKLQQLMAKLKKQKFAQCKGLENDKVKFCFEENKLFGLCYTASLSVIKTLLAKNIANEQALIQACKKYEKGFSSNVAALQTLFCALEVKEHVLKKIAEKIINNSTNLIASVIYMRKKLSFPYIEKLIGLKSKQSLEDFDKQNFSGIYQNSDIQQKFNQLKNGYYQLVFSTQEYSAHAIVYIKKQFGSYLFDPNIGLIKCSSHNPAMDLCELLGKYPGRILQDGTREHYLMTYKHVLALQV